MELDEKIWVLDPFLAERRRRGSVLGSGGLVGRLQARGLPEILLLLMQTAGLNRVEGDETFLSPTDWLGAMAREAGQFDAACGIRASSVVFAEPEKWANGEVGAALEALEWPRGRSPFGMLVGLVRDVERYEVNKRHPELGHVVVGTEVLVPGRDGESAEGPWVFLGLVTRSDDGDGWVCEKGVVQPIAATRSPFAIEWGEERRAIEALRDMVRDLESNKDLAEAVGGAISVKMERPLTRFETAGGPCLPDFLLTVLRKREGVDYSGGPGGDRFHFGDTARYVVKLVGDGKLLERRSKSERSMRNIGRVFRMEMVEVESRYKNVRRQGRVIGRYIRNDLIWRFGEAGA